MRRRIMAEMSCFEEPSRIVSDKKRWKKFAIIITHTVPAMRKYPPASMPPAYKSCKNAVRSEEV